VLWQFRLWLCEPPRHPRQAAGQFHLLEICVAATPEPIRPLAAIQDFFVIHFRNGRVVV
jgi:hypothetical protein